MTNTAATNNLTYLDNYSSFEDLLAARTNKKAEKDVWARHEDFMKSNIQLAYSAAFDKAITVGYGSKKATELARKAANDTAK